MNKENIPSLEKISEYFEMKYRGIYYNGIKQEAVKFLKEHYKLKHIEIASIVFKNTNRHDTITHYLNNRKQHPQESQISDNWMWFVNNMIYPLTKHENAKISIPFSNTFIDVRTNKSSVLYVDKCGKQLYL